MDDEYKFAYIQKQDWKPAETRPYSINFMGSQDPNRRKLILDSIRPLFVESEQSSYKSSTHKVNVWHEFSDEKPNALKPVEFVDVLSNSDFTLCPPGYSLITHRLIESLLRGSIPILNEYELDIYNSNRTFGCLVSWVFTQKWRKINPSNLNDCPNNISTESIWHHLVLI